MTPDLFRRFFGFRLELPYDVSEAVLCVVEEGLEVVLPVGGGVSSCLGEAGGSVGCRGHGDGWLWREGEKGEETRGRPPLGSSGGEGNGQGRDEENRKQNGEGDEEE